MHSIAASPSTGRGRDVVDVDVVFVARGGAWNRALRTIRGLAEWPRARVQNAENSLGIGLPALGVSWTRAPRSAVSTSSCETDNEHRPTRAWSNALASGPNAQFCFGPFV